MVGFVVCPPAIWAHLFFCLNLCEVLHTKVLQVVDGMQTLQVKMGMFVLKGTFWTPCVENSLKKKFFFFNYYYY